MDIDETRRANICVLEKLAGSPTLAANKVGMTYAQYINYRNGAKAKTGKIRGMLETAWRFEDAFGKPRGWLDVHITNRIQKSNRPWRNMWSSHPRQTAGSGTGRSCRTDQRQRMRELIGFARCLTGTHPPSRQSARDLNGRLAQHDAIGKRYAFSISQKNEDKKYSLHFLFCYAHAPLNTMRQADYERMGSQEDVRFCKYEAAKHATQGGYSTERSSARRLKTMTGHRRYSTRAWNTGSTN